MAKKGYIDAYKCREAFYNDVLSILSDDNTNDRANEIIDVFDNLPAADVQEVKHGRWITSEITMDSGCTSCSCCHSEYYIGDLQNLEGNNDFVMYCPHCGARMDGGENG